MVGKSSGETVSTNDSSSPEIGMLVFSRWDRREHAEITARGPLKDLVTNQTVFDTYNSTGLF